MAPTFAELHKNEEKIRDIITEEEVSFGRTLLKVILSVCDSLIYCFSLSFKFILSPGYRQVQEGYCRHYRWKIKWAGMSICILKILTENVQGSGLGITISFMSL